MWKLGLGFAVFAVLAIWMLGKSGGSVDMGGEKHDVSAPHSEVAAPAASAASAASN